MRGKSGAWPIADRVSLAATMLHVLFIGASTVNFGGAPGPWDHSRRLEKLGGVKVVGIADPDVDRAQDILKQKLQGPHSLMYKDCQVFSTYQDALLNTSVHVAFIGVHPHVHGSPTPPHDMELQLLKAGVHVFVEKPVSLQPPEIFLPYVQTVEELRKEKGLVVSVGYMFRYHPAVEKMKSVLAEYGRPVVGLSAVYQCAYSTLDRPLWWNMDTSGGPIVEQATHFCDLVRYLGGEVRKGSVQGLCVPYSSEPSSAGYLAAVPGNIDEASLQPGQRIPRFTTAHWSFEGGGVGSLVHGAVLQGRLYEARLELWADGLRMTLDDPYSDGCTLKIRRGADDCEEVFTYTGADPYLAEDRAFLAAVTSGDSSHVLSSYSDAAETYALSWAVRNASCLYKN